MTRAPGPRRSGCAVISGVSLIAIGSLFLAYNLLGFLGVPSLRVAIQALAWYAKYWPLLFIGWGVFKIVQRFRQPQRSYVSAAEIVVLVWILVLGLVVRGVQTVTREVAANVSLDDFAGIFGPELLGPERRQLETADFELGNASVLTIDNERGEIVILGSEDATVSVRVTKRIHNFSTTDADEAFSAAKLQFSVEGERARVSLSRGDDANAVRTDFHIRVPKAVSVNIANGRGSVRIEDLAAPVHVETARGDIVATNLSAGIEADTSHARIRLDRLTGPVVAVNQHGEIRVIRVQGDVTATTEHSSIVAEEVEGDVILRNEHGSVRVADVSGVVEITSEYSDVSVERTGANVSIASNHRPIFVHDVGGGLELEARSSRILVRGVAADVSIDNRGRPTSISDVGGHVSVISEEGGVEIESVDGNVTIESSYKDIYVANFNAELSIRTTHANVEVATRQIAGPVGIETSYGNVSLSLPSDAAIALRAHNRDGSLRSEFRELANPREVLDGDQSWEGSLGAGVHRVLVTTSYGDIVLIKDNP